MFDRAAYSYIVSAMGIVFSSFYYVDRHRDLPFWTPWRYLGQCSLLAYVLHWALIRFVFKPLWPDSSFLIFMGCYVALALILFAVAHALHWLKVRYPKQPFLVRFIIGG